MKTITELTPEQTARFPEWVEKWVAIGLSTEPADFDKAHAAALKAYAACNLEAPKVVLRMGSPYGATLGGAIANVVLKYQGAIKTAVKARFPAETPSISELMERMSRNAVNKISNTEHHSIGHRDLFTQVYRAVLSGLHMDHQISEEMARLKPDEIAKIIVEMSITSEREVDSEIRSGIADAVRAEVQFPAQSGVIHDVWATIVEAIEAQIHKPEPPDDTIYTIDRKIFREALRQMEEQNGADTHLRLMEQILKIWRSTMGREFAAIHAGIRESLKEVAKEIKAADKEVTDGVQIAIHAAIHGDTFTTVFSDVARSVWEKVVYGVAIPIEPAMTGTPSEVAKAIKAQLEKLRDDGAETAKIVGEIIRKVCDEAWRQSAFRYGVASSGLVRRGTALEVLAAVGQGPVSAALERDMADVRNKVAALLGSSSRAEIWNTLRSIALKISLAEVIEGVRKGAELQEQISKQLEIDLKEAIKDAPRNSYGGQLWAAWDAYVSFFRDVMGWRGSTLPSFEINEALTTSCGWVWWSKNVVAISDRPQFIRRDPEGQLHSTTGPSIRYPDGWSLYHFHGVAIPGDWIATPGALTAEIAIKWENIEQRRAACEILGWATITEQLGAIVIDTDPDPEIGQLIEVELPEIGRERFLRVRCGTGREFALPVPPTMQTALEANAWGYDIPTDLLLKKEFRT